MQTIQLDKLKLQSRDRVLDLGCGEGRHALATYWLFPAEQVVAVDINHRDVQTANQRMNDFPKRFDNNSCHIFVADGFALPFKENSFDVVICSEVLEHIHDYENIITEIQRVLKPGGKLALSVPRAWPEKICWWLSESYHQVEGGHIRIFHGTQLKRFVSNQAFEFQHKHFAHALHAPYWWLRCLFWNKGERFFPVRCYHKILVWDLMKSPWITRTLERFLNPLMGKSLVMYFKNNKDFL